MRVLILLVSVAGIAACASSPPQSPAPAAASPEVAAAPAAAAAAPADGEAAFQPPAGYKARVRNGQQVYCREIVPAGTMIKRQECFTEQQLAAIEQANRAYREDMRKQGVICADARCSGS